MQNPSFPNSTNPPQKRFRLFSWRTLGWCLVAFAVFITSIALFYAEEDWRGKRAWEKYRREAEARGEELNWLKFIPAAVPDNQNFAMAPFLKPLLEIDQSRTNGSIWLDTNGLNRARDFASDLRKADEKAKKGEGSPFPEPLTDFRKLAAELQKEQSSSASANKPFTQTEAAAYVLDDMKQYQPVLDELRAASRRPYSRFDIQYDAEDPVSILLPHLAPIKSIALVVRIKAEAELASGKSDAAFDDVRFILSLANSVQNEPLLISQLVRIAILNIDAEVIRKGLAEHRWSEAQLQGLQADLAKINLLKDVRLGMEGERAAFGVRLFELLHRRNERNNVLGALGALGLNGFNFAPDGWLYFEQVNCLRFYSDQINHGMNAEATQVNPRYLDDYSAQWSQNTNHFFRLVFGHKIMAQILVPALARLHQKSAAAQTSVEQALIVCALERYRMATGKYPQTLDSLAPKFLDSVPVDVCDGKPMKYHLARDGQFVLYSVGWNQKDDGGEIVLRKGKTPGRNLNEGDWVWSQTQNVQ